MKWCSQKGMALPMVLLLMVIFIALLAGLLPLVTSEARNSSYNYKWVTARYAAEAAAKYALMQIQDIVSDGGAPTNADCATIANSINNNGRLLCSTSNVNLSSSCSLNSTTVTVNGISTERKWVQIRVTGTYNGKSAIAKVNYYLKGSPIYTVGGVVDYIATGTYSHTDHNPNSSSNRESRWTIKKGDKTKNPPEPDTADVESQDGVAQVMFANPAQDDTINVTYAAAAGRNGKPVSGGGFGIYYGMIGNADNMNAYVLQYDPGAQWDKSRKYSSGDYYAAYGTLLVKKVVFEADTYIDNMNSGDFKENTRSSPGAKEVNEWNYTKTVTAGWGRNKQTKQEDYYFSGTQSEYYALPFESANDGEVLRIPLSSADDPSNSLQAIMEKYTGKSFDLDASHAFTIKTKYDSKGNLWHYIYCDDNPNPVLYFTDHSTNKTGSTSQINSSDYVLKSFKGTRTGLRVWSNEVDVSFTNIVKDGGSDKVEKTIVWLN